MIPLLVFLGVIGLFVLAIFSIHVDEKYSYECWRNL